MVKLWSSKENISQCDLTSACPYQLSYQHPVLNKYLRTRVTIFKRKRFLEMKKWYAKVNNSNTVYDSQVKHKQYKKRNLKEFFNQSLLFADNALSSRSSQMILLLHKAMAEFSKTITENPKYAYLKYTPVISGSLREKTNTFVPCEGDVTCVAIHTQGLVIQNNEASQSAIKVNLEIADKNWSRLCIKDKRSSVRNVLCPKRLQSEFCDAMHYAFENTDPELFRPFVLGPFLLKRKDKISCFYMLYRDRILRDLMVCIDFVFCFV